MLLSVNPAGKIIVQQESKLEKVFVINGSAVTEGQTVAWLKNAASHVEINELSDLLDSCLKYLPDKEPNRTIHLFTKIFKNLGELESSYYEFFIRWKQFTKFVQQHGSDDAIMQHRKELLEEIRLFRQELVDWRKKYVVYAPVDGKISFSMPLEENQVLLPGKEIAVVTPEHNSYYAQIVLPQKALRKIVIGQKAEVAFDAYPVDEYGYLEGRVQYISGTLSDSGFVVTIELNHALVTNYQKEISYIPGLQSQVSILGNNERLLKKLYYFLRGNSIK
jgi:HlyD family secretion protein